MLIILYPLNPKECLCIISMYVPCILYVVFISSNKTQYIFFILALFILQSLLHISIHLYQPRGVQKLYIAKVT
jgi:hypothetical protein